MARLNRRSATLLLVCLGLALTYALGLGLRRAVVEAQYREQGYRVPFTLESALHFRRIQLIAEHGGLPAVDTRIEYPHGVETWKTYSVGSEYLYAGLARWMPGTLSLTERLRWIEVSWFCLGIPLMGLWVGLRARSVLGGGVAAAFYAVSLASVIRSTGLELSRENFALPLLIAHLVLDALALRTGARRGGWPAAAASGLLLGLALCSWDLVQFYVLLWASYAGVRFLAGRLDLASPPGRVWACQLAGLILAGAVHPYPRTHGFLASPLMGLAYGVFLGLLVRHYAARRGLVPPAAVRFAAASLVLLLPVLAALALGGGFGATYGHFAELLQAKLMFLNRKPADPGLLTFNQRIMWVPALHSADIRLTFIYFPAMLLLNLIGPGVLAGTSRGRTDSGLFQLFFFSSASLVTFALFVRFHVFLAVFLCALTGTVVALAWQAGGWRRWTLVSLTAVSFVIEAARVAESPASWGRKGVYYRELDELTDWLRANAGGEPVLANFGTSASALAYADCPVLLHPKFETAAIRDRVEAYAEQLYKGNEQTFRDWAEREGARYYVHGIGSFSKRSPEYQMRYFADAMDPPDTAPARRFERGDRDLEYFQWQWENRKYRVYRMKTGADERAAEAAGLRAEAAFQRGALDEAEREAMAALTFDPKNLRALETLRHVTALREKGFSYRGE